MPEDDVSFLRHGSKLYRDGNDSHEGLSFVAGLDGGVRVRKTVEFFPHGGNDVLTWVAVARFA